MRLREVGGTQEDGVWVWAERSRLAVQGEGRGRGSAASIGGELTEEMSVEEGGGAEVVDGWEVQEETGVRLSVRSVESGCGCIGM